MWANHSAETPRRQERQLVWLGHISPRKPFLELKLHASHFSNMTRDTRHSRLLTGLLCLFAAQLPLANAQVADIEKATNASLLWGPYRPNLYFGVRPRIPKSLMGGLMWTRVEDYTSVQNSECIHMPRQAVDMCQRRTYWCTTARAVKMDC
jgi:hypothetical protein